VRCSKCTCTRAASTAPLLRHGGSCVAQGEARVQRAYAKTRRLHNMDTAGALCSTRGSPSKPSAQAGGGGQGSCCLGTLGPTILLAHPSFLPLLTNHELEGDAAKRMRQADEVNGCDPSKNSYDFHFSAFSRVQTWVGFALGVNDVFTRFLIRLKGKLNRQNFVICTRAKKGIKLKSLSKTE